MPDSLMLTMLCGHMTSAQSLEGLEIKVSCTSGQPCLCDQVSIKTLDTKTWVSFPGWPYSMYVVILLLGVLSTSTQLYSMRPTRRSALELFWICFMHFFPGLILISFPLL